MSLFCLFQFAQLIVHYRSDSSANDPTNTFITNTYEIGGSFRDIAVATDIADVSFVPSEDGICRVECYEAENAKHTVAVEAETW